MKIKFLGTTGYHPNEERHTSCIMLPEEGIVLDAGSGFFRVRKNLQTHKLDILLSHYHPDHVCGITYMLDMFYDKDTDVHIWGMEGIETLEQRLDFPIPFSHHPFSIQLHEINDDFELNGFSIKIREFPHIGKVIGYRMEKNDKTLVYITDTPAVCTEVEFAKDADLLIHDCYFNAELQALASPKHSYTLKVAEVAKKANVKKLILCHMNPLQEPYTGWEEEAREIFPNTKLAYDNMGVEI